MSFESNVTAVAVRSSETTGGRLTAPNKTPMNLQEYTPVGVVAVAGHALFIQASREGAVLTAHDLGPYVTVDETVDAFLRDAAAESGAWVPDAFDWFDSTDAVVGLEAAQLELLDDTDS